MNRLTRRIASQVRVAGRQVIEPVKSSTSGVCQVITKGSCEVTTTNTLLRLQRNLATSSAAQVQLMPSIFRTDEADPAKHSDIHHGLFYTIPSDTASLLFVLGGFDKEQQLMLKTFRETSLMVRKPALEIINYLNKTDFSRPPNRYVLCKLRCSVFRRSFFNAYCL